MSYLKDLPENEREEIIKKFINILVLDLRVELSVDEINHIYSRMYKLVSDGTFNNSSLYDIQLEILRNYKKYIPFCYASIRTALYTISK